MKHFWENDTKGQICKAAVRAFYKRGYYAATMRNIGEAAGIRAPSIYNHFPTKQAILNHIMIKTMTELKERARMALATTLGNPLSRLNAFVEAHIRFHVEYVMEATITDNELRALSPQNRANILKLRDEYEAILRSIINEGVHEGVFTETNIKLTSIAILTMCTAITIWYRPGGLMSVDEIVAIYTRFALSMVGYVATETA